MEIREVKFLSSSQQWAQPEARCQSAGGLVVGRGAWGGSSEPARMVRVQQSQPYFNALSLAGSRFTSHLQSQARGKGVWPSTE